MVVSRSPVGEVDRIYVVLALDKIRGSQLFVQGKHDIMQHGLSYVTCVAKGARSQGFVQVPTLVRNWFRIYQIIFSALLPLNFLCCL